METDELKNIWVEVEGILTPKTKEELKQILLSKSRKVLKNFHVLLYLDIIVSLIVLAYLIITSLNRLTDFLYLLNNGILIVVITFILIAFGYYLNFMVKHRKVLTVFDQIEIRIHILTNNRKYSFMKSLLLPLIVILMMLSINVYFSGNRFTDAFRDEENLFGLLAGFIFALTTAYYIHRKMNRFYEKELMKLKHYQKELKEL